MVGHHVRGASSCDLVHRRRRRSIGALPTAPRSSGSLIELAIPPLQAQRRCRQRRTSARGRSWPPRHKLASDPSAGVADGDRRQDGDLQSSSSISASITAHCVTRTWRRRRRGFARPGALRTDHVRAARRCPSECAPRHPVLPDTRRCRHRPMRPRAQNDAAVRPARRLGRDLRPTGDRVLDLRAREPGSGEQRHR
jgi:hypothetical protein